MNSLLAWIVGWLNAVLAILIVLVCALVGYEIYEAYLHPGTGILGIALGSVIGLVVAVLICGGMALLVGIHDSLRQLLELNLQNNEAALAAQQRRTDYAASLAADRLAARPSAPPVRDDLEPTPGG